MRGKEAENVNFVFVVRVFDTLGPLSLSSGSFSVFLIEGGCLC